MKRYSKYPVDLHCHTHYSDGDYSTEELLHYAKKSGVDIIAITDHDTTRGLSRAIYAGRNIGIQVIPGIEISAFDFKRNCKAHIIGLFIEPFDTRLNEFCTPVLLQRHEASWQTVLILQQLGYPIDWDELCRMAAPSPVVYRQHIMQYLQKKKYIPELFGTLYHFLFNRTNGVACFPIHYLDAHEAVRMVKFCGGVPILAHPVLEHNEDLVPELYKTGLAGCELRHPSHLVDAEKAIKNLINNTSMFISGGSDFHGHFEKHIHEPGSCGVTIEEWEQILTEHKTKNKNALVYL